MDNVAKRVVDITITRENRGVASADFSTPLFLSSTAKVATAITRVESYGNASEMLKTTPAYLTTDPEYLACVTHFNQSTPPPVFKIGLINGAEKPDVALTNCIAVDNNFYGVLVNVGTVSADMALLATACKANGKFFFYGDKSATTTTTGDTTSIPYALNLAGNSKTCAIYDPLLRNGTSAGFADVAFASMVLGKSIGSYTASYKGLSGVTPLNTTTATITEMYKKNVTWYNTIYGRNVTENCRVLDGTIGNFTMNTGGEYIDVEIGLDWLQTTMQEDVLGLIFSVNKIPYSDEGVAMLTSAIAQRLEIAVARGLILPNYSISAGKASDQSNADKTARRFNALKWTATLAGAIEHTVINGTVRV